MGTSTKINDSILTIYIEEFEVFTALSNLDSNKATGPDNIGPKILKQCATFITQPIHYLFNLILSYSMIPKEWKTHQIVPVFKSGDKSLVQNYRPISLLCNIFKILEHIINNKIILFVSSSISHCQFGFLRGRSTIQQLLLFLNHICNSISEGHQHNVIYMDFRKAFDSVSHNDLLTKLWSFGITGRLWQWFRCYLLNRQQCVPMRPCTVGKKPSVKADLAIYSQAVDVRGQCMSESLKLGHNLDFSSCDIMIGFHKSSHN